MEAHKGEQTDSKAPTTEVASESVLSTNQTEELQQKSRMAAG
jgi:hypothetical protein